MINIGTQIETSTPSRSLFMTYCASLPFFERDILPHLQQVGEGRVTVLLDNTQYQASFSDFVRGAGTRYRLHPVRLPHSSANFHPKLYLLIKGSKVDLLVGSANLTPSGFRANAEIVDQLTLSEERQQDAPAVAQYVGMLRLLPNLDPHLPGPVLQEIETFASDLERLGAQQTSTRTGPWFLHSIEEALLPQVARLIPPSEIEQITAISPFFDEKSSAVLKIAATFDNANIRLIKGAEPDSLNGEALTKLGRRITVEEWRALSDEQQRRLHAKVMVLRSNSDEWVISGSANLTRSAWLSPAVSANSAGNVEAVVVRRLPLGSTTRLLKSINTQKVDHRSLRRATTVPTNSGDNAFFTIVDAELRNQEVTIRVELHNGAPESARFRVYLDQNGRHLDAAPHATRSGDRVCLSVSVRNHKLDRDHPIASTVEMNARGQQPVRMRTWVAVPATLAFNSSQRSVRAAARNVCRRVFGQDEAAGVIADAITRFLTDLGGLAHDQAGHGSSAGQGQPVVEDVDRQLSKREFIISDDELGALHAIHARTVQALTGLAALLERLLVAADEVENIAAPADDVDESRPEDEEGDDSNKASNGAHRDRKREVKRAEETLDQLNAAFRETVAEALRQEVSERTVPLVLNLPSAAIAYLLLHAQIRRRLELDCGHTVSHDIREILREAFSIDGMALGGSYGWLIRAWASEQCRPGLDAMLQANGSTNELLAFAAAGLGLGGPLRDNDAVAQGILAGLHLLCGRVPREDVGMELRQRLEAVSQSSGGTLGTEDLQSVLMSFAPEKSNVISLVRRWTAMARIDEANADPIRVSGEIAALQRVAPKLWDDYSCLRERLKPALAQASATEDAVTCHGCQMILPGNTAQRLTAPVGDYVACDYCHRILIPVHVNDGICEQIVRGLEFMAEVMYA